MEIAEPQEKILVVRDEANTLKSSRFGPQNIEPGSSRYRSGKIRRTDASNA